MAPRASCGSQSFHTAPGPAGFPSKAADFGTLAKRLRFWLRSSLVAMQSLLCNMYYDEVWDPHSVVLSRSQALAICKVDSCLTLRLDILGGNLDSDGSLMNALTLSH